MVEQPLVSILLLSMNHELYIKECIDSIINQTYKNIEIIYLDNASEDNTFKVGKKILEESGITHKSFANKESKSISKNINFLLDNSSGQYICPLSTDDWFHPFNVEKKIDHFLSHKNIAALYSNGWIYTHASKETVLNNSTAFKRGNIYKEILLQPDCIYYVGIMYNRQILEEAGKWDENLLIEDVDLLLRISMIAPIDFIDTPLVYYRRTEGSVSKNYEFMLRGYQQYYEKYKSAKWISMKEWLAERYRSIAANYIDQKNKSQAIPLLKNAMKLNPFEIKNYKTFMYLLRS